MNDYTNTSSTVILVKKLDEARSKKLSLLNDIKKLHKEVENVDKEIEEITRELSK